MSSCGLILPSLNWKNIPPPNIQGIEGATTCVMPGLKSRIHDLSLQHKTNRAATRSSLRLAIFSGHAFLVSATVACRVRGVGALESLLIHGVFGARFQPSGLVSPISFLVSSPRHRLFRKSSIFRSCSKDHCLRCWNLELQELEEGCKCPSKEICLSSRGI